MNAWRADPLVWGHGPRIFEMFLEPTCPFSVKAFGKLDDLLEQAGENNWEMFTCLNSLRDVEGTVDLVLDQRPNGLRVE